MKNQWTYSIMWHQADEARVDPDHDKRLGELFQPDAVRCLITAIENIRNSDSAYLEWWKAQDLTMDRLIETGAEILATAFVAEGKLEGVSINDIDYIAAYAPEKVYLEVPA